jgi:hypothetical protein
MKSYIHPEIISKILQLETAMSQYGFGQTPECDGGSACANTGVSQCDGGETTDTASVIFFLPGADLDHAPEFCNITGVADFIESSDQVSGSNCTFTPVEACEDGAVWEITCVMPVNFCDPDEIKVDCQGAPSECSFPEA